MYKVFSPKLYFRNYSHQIMEALNTVDDAAIDAAYNLIENNFLHLDPIITFGNGGSAAIADHFVTDFIKCVGHDCENYTMGATCLTSNSPLFSCIANDYGYEESFAKQIEFWPWYGTLCIGISSSGRSRNIVRAFETIAEKKRVGEYFHSIALVGFSGGDVLANNMADVVIHVKANNYGVVEDCHSIILHSLIQKLRINNTKDITKIQL